MDIDPALFVQGLKDARSGGKTILTEAEAKAVMSELQMKMVARNAEAAKVAGERNKAEGEAFLAANKSTRGDTSVVGGILGKQRSRSADLQRPAYGTPRGSGGTGRRTSLRGWRSLSPAR